MSALRHEFVLDGTGDASRHREDGAVKPTIDIAILNRERIDFLRNRLRKRPDSYGAAILII